MALLGEFPVASPVIPGPGAEPAPKPGPAVPPTRSPSASARELHRELIELGLTRGRDAMAIWQDPVSEAGTTSGYQSARRAFTTSASCAKVMKRCWGSRRASRNSRAANFV